MSKTNRIHLTVIACIIVMAILLAFIFAINETVEITIVVLFFLASFMGLYYGIIHSKKILIGISLLLGAISFGLAIWSEHNIGIRNDRVRNAKWKEIRIKNREDSIKQVKDSLKMLEDSKRLYAQEGDSIFGKFKFGMSEAEYDKIVNEIQKETNGVISIAGHDFVISSKEFYNDKLYLLTLTSARNWVRYYYHDAHEYDDSEGYGNGFQIIEKIKKHLSKKYGEPNHGDNWHFTYKDIIVHSYMERTSKEGLLSTEYWAVFLKISNPQLVNTVKKREEEREQKIKEEREKAEEEREKAEEELQRKKESYGSGL